MVSHRKRRESVRVLCEKSHKSVLGENCEWFSQWNIHPCMKDRMKNPFKRSYPIKGERKRWWLHSWGNMKLYTTKWASSKFLSYKGVALRLDFTALMPLKASMENSAWVEMRRPKKKCHEEGSGFRSQSPWGLQGVCRIRSKDWSFWLFSSDIETQFHLINGYSMAKKMDFLDLPSLGVNTSKIGSRTLEWMVAAFNNWLTFGCPHWIHFHIPPTTGPSWKIIYTLRRRGPNPRAYGPSSHLLPPRTATIYQHPLQRKWKLYKIGF